MITRSRFDASQFLKKHSDIFQLNDDGRVTIVGNPKLVQPGNSELSEGPADMRGKGQGECVKQAVCSEERDERGQAADGG